MLGNHDLYTLLNLLRPDIVIDEGTFAHMSAPNPHINRAVRAARGAAEGWQAEALDALDTAGNTEWGKALLRVNPEFARACCALASGELAREDRVRLVRVMEGFHSFATIINRTRRRDIGDFCVRKPETVTIEFTPDQKALHDQLLAFHAKALADQHGGQNVQFMMTTLKRQAASCLFGLAPQIDDLVKRRLDALDLAALDEDWESPPDAPNEIVEFAGEIAELARSLPEEDPKYDRLAQIINGKQVLPNNKIIVFSTFRHTLAYLERRLLGDGFRVGLVHGGVDDVERQEIRGRFELPRENQDALDVLLFSEVGCEGLDYQFCDAMVNYDLPWNPMRIEQRIGRIDRRGQKSEVVAVYNLITADTIDEEIYHRCLWRIGVFQASIGDCDEILGKIAQGIKSIAENLSLTESERLRKLEQLADNEVGKIEEWRAIEDRQHELFGFKTDRAAFDEEVREAESPWLTPAALLRLVNAYLQDRVGPGEYFLGEKAQKTLRINADGRAKLLEDFRKCGLAKSPMNLEWERWLKGGDQHLPVTFDMELAADNRFVQFIMPLHPLVRQAANLSGFPKAVHTALRVVSAELSPGMHPFAVYAWEQTGLRRELRFVPVCADNDVQETLFSLLETGITVEGDIGSPDNQTTFGELDARHYTLWTAALEKHRKQTREMCRYRRESLEISHKAQLRAIDEQITAAKNEKISRMREAQREKRWLDYERRVLEIESALDVVDILAKLIIVGLIHIVKENS